mgnify:CR=1 FL=1
MKMRREIQRGAKALDGGYCAATAASDSMVETGAAALVGKQCAKKSTQHFACQPRIPRTAVAQGIWQGEDPLAHRDLGDHAVHEMSGGARHASSAA